MRQAIIDLYDDMTHGRLERRVFMERLVGLTGSAAAAGAALAALRPDYAQAALVAPEDSRLSARMTSVEAGGKTIKVYRARPAGTSARKPAVLVVHENRGLNAHIEDVARRLALDGFLVGAPDLLSTRGGTPKDEDKAREMIGQLDIAEALGQLGAVVASYQIDSDSNGKVGLVGFCWGGGVVNQAAVRSVPIAAGVAYYGRTPDPAMVPGIEAPLLLHYAGQDTGVNQGVPAYEAALKSAGKRYQAYTYEGAQHAFNNDTSEARYDKTAADLAWGRTVAFLKENLA